MLTKIDHDSFACTYCKKKKKKTVTLEQSDIAPFIQIIIGILFNFFPKQLEMGATIGNKVNYLIKQMLPENAGTRLTSFDETVTDI